MPSISGSLLIARKVLQDPHFRQAVVLLLQHGEEGAFGLVVNRPGKMEGLPFPIYAGGPCESPGMILLHGHNEWLDPLDESPTPEIAPGIFMGDATCFKRIKELEPGQFPRFRVFAGYAGWGPNQLEREIDSGAWALVPANAQMLFDFPVEELWLRLLPPTIPDPSLN
jgi:putative transcriptional regulator